MIWMEEVARKARNWVTHAGGGYGCGVDGEARTGSHAVHEKLSIASGIAAETEKNRNSGWKVVERAEDGGLRRWGLEGSQPPQFVAGLFYCAGGTGLPVHNATGGGDASLRVLVR